MKIKENSQLDQKKLIKVLLSIHQILCDPGFFQKDKIFIFHVKKSKYMKCLVIKTH